MRAADPPPERGAGDFIYGINPVLALLADPERLVESVTFLKGGHGQRLQEAIELARQRGLRPHFADRITLDRLSNHAVHQGVVARVGLRRQPSFDDILDRVQQASGCLLLLLDTIEDPRNLGAVIRSAEAFGAMAVILPRDRTAPLSSVAIKSSAGAGERLDVVRVINLARAIVELQDRGVQVYGLAAEGNLNLAELTFGATDSVALVLGGEGKGLRRLTREKCDGLVSIPMVGEVGSLNVAVAAGIGLYGVRCQRKPGCRVE
ncbi:MAG: 23S rRNA (guanosine(2251)-2'-O)-methyltransferase RlmB [Magnetococcales bacterium]|nr:23S rRNA (guanosine(2251)-2'-O)-methyltransferase RlmB [Magnetococcales bacterium]